MSEMPRKGWGARAVVFAVATLLLIAVLTPLGTPRLADAGTAPLSGGGYTAFVASASGATLSAFDAASPGAPEIAPLAAPPGGIINQVAIDPRSDEVLATVGPGAVGDTVAGVQAYSALTGQPIGGVVALPLGDPGSIAIDPAGTTAWVGDWRSGQVASLALNGSGPPAPGAATFTVPGLDVDYTATVCALAVSPDGSRLYVGASDDIERFIEDTPPPAALCGPSRSEQSFPSRAALYGYQIGTAAGPTPTVAWQDAPLFTEPTEPVAALPPLPAGSISALSVTPDGGSLFVAVREEDEAGALNTSGLVTAVTGLPGAPSPPASVFPQTGALVDPAALAITPGGSSLYIADDAGNGAIDQLGLPGPGAATTLGGTGPVTALAVTPDGSRLLAAGSAGSSLASLPIAPSAPLPASFAPLAGVASPTALAVTPDQAPVASVSANPSNTTPGSTVTLNATTSSVLYGAITQYVWSFGDGSPPVTTASAVITHSYGAPGTYTVTVVETDGAGTSVPPAFAAFPVDFTGQTASKRADPSAQASTALTITNPPPPPPTTAPPTTAPATTATTAPTTATTRPATTTTHPTTTTIPSSTIPSTTTTTPPPPPGSPVLTVNPGIGPPGIVVQFSGQNFPPNTAIALQWSPGIGSAVVTSSATGAIAGSILVFYRDQIGSRLLMAVGFPTAKAPFLVVPAPNEPAGSSEQFLFRR
jgi:PKD domain